MPPFLCDFQDVQKVFAEIKFYKEDSLNNDEKLMMIGVLCLLGRDRSTLRKDWGHVRSELGREVVTEMLELDFSQISVEDLKRRWASSVRTKREANSESGSAPSYSTESRAHPIPGA